nr:oxygenase MpaB family protein [Nocardioides convexus]
MGRHGLGVPICQAYLGYTLVEFTLIPLRAMRRIGAPYLPEEEAAAYARWRYLGHLLGIEEALLPRDAAEQERLEEIYLLTRPEVDDYCRSLVASINRDFLVPEIEGVLPRRLARHAPRLVHALERLFLGDEIADEPGDPAHPADRRRGAHRPGADRAQRRPRPGPGDAAAPHPQGQDLRGRAGGAAAPGLERPPRPGRRLARRRQAPPRPRRLSGDQSSSRPCSMA